jgi:hypothetical protein
MTKTKGYWNSWKNRRQFLIELGKKRGNRCLDDWYTVTVGEIRKNGGASPLIHHYNSSPFAFLKDCFPKHNWSPEKLTKVPNGHWNDRANRRQYLIELGKRRGNLSWQDFYTMTQDEVRSDKSAWSIVSNHYNCTILLWLKDCLPDYPWEPEKFTHKPNGYWNSWENRRKWLIEFGKQRGNRCLDDWYNLKQKEFQGTPGWAILTHQYNSSHLAFLVDCFPEYNWLPWKFVGSAPNNYWKDRNQNPILKNIKWFVSWFEAEVNITSKEDWYKITRTVIDNNYGMGLINSCFRGSVYDLVKYVYPEYRWLPWMFTNAPNGFWFDTENIKWWISWYMETHGYTTLDELYAMTYPDVIAYNGGALWTRKRDPKYRNPYELLTAVYPDHSWLPWRFVNTIDGFWRNLDNVRWYLSWLGERLWFTSMDDWYCLSKEMLENNHGSGLLDNYNNSPSEIIKKAYPNHAWEHVRFSNTWKYEALLYNIVKTIFPDAILHAPLEQMPEDLQSMRFPSGRPMKPDIWVPSRRMGIEYQGEQHFKPTFFGEKERFVSLVDRDEKKRTTAKSNGVIWIEVAYNEWNGSPRYIEELLSPYI